MVSLALSTDAELDLAEIWLKPGSKAAFLTGDTHQKVTAEQMREYREQGAIEFFTISAGPAGPVGLVNFRRSIPGCFSIGGTIGPEELWSRGFGAEGFGLLIYHLFMNEQAERVEVSTGVHNPFMTRMLTSSRLFTLEGVHRRSMLIEGRRYDRSTWSMLREEFEEKYGEKVPDREDSDGSGDFTSDADVESSAKAIKDYILSSQRTSFDAYTGEDTTNRI